MSQKKTSSNVPSFVRKAFKALQTAVKKTIEDHQRTGDPIVVLRNGKVVLVRVRHHRRAV